MRHFGTDRHISASMWLGSRGSIHMGFGGQSWDFQLSHITCADTGCACWATASMSVLAVLWLQFRHILKSKEPVVFFLENTWKYCLLGIVVVEFGSCSLDSCLSDANDVGGCSLRRGAKPI